MTYSVTVFSHDHGLSRLGLGLPCTAGTTIHHDPRTQSVVDVLIVCAGRQATDLSTVYVYHDTYSVQENAVRHLRASHHYSRGERVIDVLHMYNQRVRLLD